MGPPSQGLVSDVEIVSTHSAPPYDKTVRITYILTDWMRWTFIPSFHLLSLLVAYNTTRQWETT